MARIWVQVSSLLSQLLAFQNMKLDLAETTTIPFQVLLSSD